MSGGQKQRISIARAVYSDGDIYLIDDSLSALDADVGKKIMDQVLLGDLRSKTRVMVTNKIKHLQSVDRVILIKKGRIILDGDYREIKSHPEFIEFCEQKKDVSEVPKTQKSSPESPLSKRKNSSKIANLNESEEAKEKKLRTEKNEKENKKPSTNGEDNKLNQGVLTQEESRARGLTSSKVYCYYLSSAGCCLVLTTVLLYIAFTLFKIITDWYVGKWATQSLNLTTNQYPLIYLAMIGILTLIVSLRSLTFGMTFSKASFSIFKKVTWNLLRRPLSFFDTTPSGVIINRCSKDVNDSDYKIPSYFFIIMDYTLRIMTTLLFLCYIFPYFLVVMLIIIYMFFRSLITFMKSLIEFKRLVKISTSPLLSRISELLSGIMTLRSYKMIPYMEKRFIRQSNLLAVVDYHERQTYRWFRIRVELPIWLCMVIGIVVLSIDKKYPFLGKNDPVLKGLLVAYLVTLVNLCGRLMIFAMKIMKEMSSIERLHEYAKWRDHERDWDSPSPEQPNWPRSGGVEIENVRVRYRPGLPLVLKGLSFMVSGGEKVGIIGRTGSGKSTLLLALMRIIELDLDQNEIKEGSGQVYSGRSFMKIDGENLSRVGLHHARKSMVIIPQDPFLLQGTLRYNLDPMNEFSDEDVIEALEKVDGINIIGKALTKRGGVKNQSPTKGNDQNDSLSTMASETDRGSTKKSKKSRKRGFIELESNPSQPLVQEILNLEIADQGSNLSLGQRQLVCIARALVKKPKILLMDEATANIDERTDEVIQEVINNQLEGTTVLTIAHRLNTIIKYDKIVVLDQGVKVEEGSPLELLEDENSIFSDMVSKGGSEFSLQMKQIVGLAYSIE